MRLSGLAILSIENKRARSLDVKSVVKYFAHRFAKRRRLSGLFCGRPVMEVLGLCTMNVFQEKFTVDLEA